MNFKTTKLNPFGLLIEPVEGKEAIQNIEINDLKNAVANDHLIVLRGFHSFENVQDFTGYCEKFGEICLWPFGKVLELVAHDNPEDHIFDNTYIPMHWDGMYRKQVPENQFFHCVSAPGIDNRGGTTFSNTKLLLQDLPESTLKTWRKISCEYSRKMEFYDSKTVAPLITKHPEYNYNVIRFCEPPKSGDTAFVNHPDFKVQGIAEDEVTHFIDHLNDLLYDPKYLYTHRWETGDVVISDNHTLLHGREPFTKGAPRHLRRIQLLGETPLNNPHLIFTQ